MNILFVSEGLTQSSVIAQPWRHVNEIALRLMKLGNSVQILTECAPHLPPEEEINGVTVFRTKKGRFLFDNEKLLRHLNRTDIDIINWHGSDLWSAIHLWRLRRKLRNDVVWTLHSGPISFRDLKNLSYSQYFSLYNFWNNFLNAFCPSLIIKKWINTPQLKLIITLSERTKDRVQRMGIGEEKVKVIRSGVDTERFRPITESEVNRFREEAGFRPEDDIVMYFGPLSSFRGADTAILAISEVQNTIPSAKLLLLDRNPSSNIEAVKLRELAQRRKGVFIVSGLLEKDALIRYLAISNAIALPFKFWPQVECPLTLLEAMAVKKPVVTTNYGAIPEIIVNDQNGFLVNPGEPKALATTLVRLLNNKDLSTRIAENAFRSVHKFYDWNIIADQTLAAFKNVLGCVP